jgi:hypothetical protein
MPRFTTFERRAGERHDGGLAVARRFVFHLAVLCSTS